MERRLITFLTVAELGSFQSAADTLNVAPSTVTDRIQRLESELGRALFRRMPRSIHLTEAGREFLRYAQRTLRALDEGRRALRTLRTGSAVRALVVSSKIPALLELPRIWQRLRAGESDHDRRLHLQAMTSKQVFRTLISGRADVGLANIRFRHPELATELVSEYGFAVVGASPGTASEAGDGDGMAKRDLPILYFEEELEDTLRVHSLCLQLGWSRASCFGVPDLAVLTSLLRSGYGVGVVPRPVVADDIALGVLTELPVRSDVVLPRQVTCLLVRRGVESEAQYPLAVGFVAAVREHYRQNRPTPGPAAGVAKP